MHIIPTCQNLTFFFKMSGISSLNLCGKNSESQSRRLVFPNHNAYSSKVLVGPWVQERLNAIETPQKPHRLISTTKEDFSEKKSVVDHSIAWDQKIRSEVVKNCPKRKLNKSFLEQFF